MSLIIERYLQVDYSHNSALNFYKKLKNLRGNTSRFSMLKRFHPLAGRMISVTEPLGRISIMKDPVRYRGRIGGEQISILTANLWHDWPRRRWLKERLECFIELVIEEDVDVLLLQELVRTKDFRSDEWLADQLGMAYVYSRANGHASQIGFEEGLAVFSRFPINNPRLAQLSIHKNPLFRRIALGVDINFNGRDFLAFNVHLGISNRQNEGQFHRLMEWVDEQSGNVPAVIGGDFNAREKTAQIRKAQNSWRDTFREWNPHQEGYTHEILWPWGGILSRSRVDYLFLKKGITSWGIDEARQIKSRNCQISDHTPVIVKAHLTV